MRNAAAATALLVCFLAFAPASYATRYTYDFETCKAAWSDYKAAETASDAVAKRLGGGGPKGSARYHGKRAADYAAAGERIPASCNCLVALAAADEAIQREQQASNIAWAAADWAEKDRAGEAVYAHFGNRRKAYACFAKRERQAQAEREKQRAVQEVTQPAPDPVRKMCADFEKLERDL